MGIWRKRATYAISKSLLLTWSQRSENAEGFEVTNHDWRISSRSFTAPKRNATSTNAPSPAVNMRAGRERTKRGVSSEVYPKDEEKCSLFSSSLLNHSAIFRWLNESVHVASIISPPLIISKQRLCRCIPTEVWFYSTPIARKHLRHGKCWDASFCWYAKAVKSLASPCGPSSSIDTNLLRFAAILACRLSLKKLAHSLCNQTQVSDKR